MTVEKNRPNENCVDMITKAIPDMTESFAQFAAAVTGVDAEEGREPVEVAVAVLVVDVAAVGADDDRDLVVGPVGPHPREQRHVVRTDDRAYRIDLQQAQLLDGAAEVLCRDWAARAGAARASRAAN